MANAETQSGVPFWPAALRRGMAAQYIGCSAGHFDKLVRAGIMPPGQMMGNVKVWLRGELDAALSELPAVSDDEPQVATSADEIDAMIERVQ